MDLPTLTLSDLERAVAGGVAAIRSRTQLQPAGGPGDKVFPPTYTTGDKTLKYATGDKTLKYAREIRRIDGADVECVLLDSVASQANRMEQALLRAWEDRSLTFPVVGIDFTGDPELADLGRLSTLLAPHRIFDALLRDSVVDGVLFRDTPAGRSVTDATWRNATAMYRLCPTALIFGSWDSTGPKGASGTKFQRAIVSEVVAVHATAGAKTASRLDPAGIQANVEVYEDKDRRSAWTIDPKQARTEKGKPVPFSRKGAEGKGKPSAINHGNIAPSIDVFAGGVTFDHALQTTVLSLPALRRLRFPVAVGGGTLDEASRPKAENAARTALAALAVAAIACHRDAGFDLRSRCALVPEGPLVMEAVPSDGGEPKRFSMSSDDAKALVVDAHAAAKRLGFEWEREPLRLVPAPKLADLIKRSRALAAAGAGHDDGPE